MHSKTFGIVYALVMIALIVGIDLLFLRDQPWLRLITNIGIVLLFGVGYFFLVSNRD